MRNTNCFRWLWLLMAAFVLSAPIVAQKDGSSSEDQSEKPRPTLIIEPVNVGPRNPALYVPYRPGDFSPAEGDRVDVDVTGTPSYDGRGAACNIRRTVAAPAGRDSLNGIGWAVQLTATSPSWLSEIAVLITNVYGDGYVLRPGAGDNFGGTRFYTSNGVRKLRTDFNLPDLELPDGTLYLEFYETFNDFPGCGQDGNWDSGTITFQFGTAPPFPGWDENRDGGGDAGDLPETSQSTGCQGDVNHDGQVDDADLLDVLFAFGQTGSCLREDTDANGAVDDADLLNVLFSFGCTGFGELTAIRGRLGENDVDMYAIYISDPSQFSASTSGTTGFDTQLFLFDCNGRGVVHNDDNPAGGLQSIIDNSTNCIPGPGVYYLAISRYNRDPAGCGSGLIWNNTPFTTIRCPDGPEFGSRVNGWTGSPPAAGSYIITLQGARSAAKGDPSDCQ